MKQEEKDSAQIIIFFDGFCYLCSSAVNFLIGVDKESKFKFSPITSEFAGRTLTNIKEKLGEIDSIIILKNDKYYIKSNAVIEIIKELKWHWRLLLILKVLPEKIRDKLYDFVAANRFKWFEKKGECMIPSEDVRSRFLID
ncbi:MAG: DCC1-like thiol-disulfide oxidoreductase family protein [Melioribacteraceae bacterium]|nr:DCC1-like thiol-disulfide oxidoreductase family protein [Melioribacteraceae bacterium]MCF8353049.1 DCC1-like thiol-disulfide oxidoreductase family protein [Melioribacteraceae bacterium]MCF8392940.1 DCC1-like thiol-disulfide oxidoreductase family protein [Melioribacteraceae bacterium]MCF8417765.1 DCC1-like thiol-disulfide oxidoreductase family protein [Melioribacteraceae bacterium]